MICCYAVDLENAKTVIGSAIMAILKRDKGKKYIKLTDALSE